MAVQRGSEAPPRAWQRMLSGRRLDLLDPSPLDIEIEDIAHGLARVARWNGQTSGDSAFSVAQHCLMVEEIAVMVEPELDRIWRLAALLHDAPEYVIGDMISPFKAVIGDSCGVVGSRGSPLSPSISAGPPAPPRGPRASPSPPAERPPPPGGAPRPLGFAREEAIGSSATRSPSPAPSPPSWSLGRSHGPRAGISARVRDLHA